MNEYLARMRAFWAGRSIRERAILGMGFAVVLFGLGYGLIVDPLIKANRKMAASLPKQRAELRLIRAQVSEVERLRSKSKNAAKSGSSLIHTIESAAAAHGAREAMGSLSPLSADRVRVTAGPMAVTVWLAWFADLEQQGVTVASLRLTTDDKPGQVSIEATLAGGST